MISVDDGHGSEVLYHLNDDGSLSAECVWDAVHRAKDCLDDNASVSRCGYDGWGVASHVLATYEIDILGLSKVDQARVKQDIEAYLADAQFEFVVRAVVEELREAQLELDVTVERPGAHRAKRHAYAWYCTAGHLPSVVLCAGKETYGVEISQEDDEQPIVVGAVLPHCEPVGGVFLFEDRHHAIQQTSQRQAFVVERAMEGSAS